MFREIQRFCSKRQKALFCRFIWLCLGLFRPKREQKAACKEFADSLDSMDKEEFERQTARMNSRVNDLTKKYGNYRKAEEDYLNAKKAGDENLIAECRNKLNDAKREYVLTSVRHDNDEIREAAKQFHTSQSVKWVKGDEGLMDFNTVMSDLCSDKLGSVLWKLDAALSFELNDLESLQKLEEKMINEQERALKKGDPKSLKKAEKLMEDYKKELKKRENDRIKKLESLRKKAEAAKKKEEEKERKAREKELKKKKK